MGKLRDPLTEREETLMHMLATGMTEKTIASVLVVHVTSVNKLTASIRDKLGAKATVHAMHLWTAQSPLMERLAAQLKRLR